MRKKSILILVLIFVFCTRIVSAEEKSFIKEYTYQASEADSRISSRFKATTEVKRLLLEELGTYIEGYTEVSSYRLTKDQIKTYVGGNVKKEILQEKWDGERYWVRVKLIADPVEVAKHVDAVRKDNQRRKELENKAIQLSKAIDLFEEGLRYVNDSNFDRALTALSASISADPQFYEAYVIRGTLYGRHGQSDLAIQDFNKAISNKPTDPEGYMGMALAMTYQGKYDQAIANYDKAIKNDPDYDLAYYHRGQVYFFLKDYAKAVEDFYRAVDINPREVIKITSKNISLNPDKAYISYFVRGIARNKVGDGVGACIDFSEMAKIHRLYADNAFKESLNRDSNNYAIYCGRAFASASLGSHGNAIIDFTKCLEINPNFSAAYFGLGLSQEFLNQLPEAIGNYGKACKLGDTYACKKLNELKNDRITHDNEKENKLVNLIEKEKIAQKEIIEQYDPEKSKLHTEVGDIFFSLGSYRQSIDSYGRAIIFYPKYSEAYYKRGLVYDKIDNNEQAIEDYKIAAKLGHKKAQVLLKNMDVAW